MLRHQQCHACVLPGCVCLQTDPSRSVPLSAAAKGMTHFVAVPADQENVCRPTSCTHTSFVALRQFLQQVMQVRNGPGVLGAVLASCTRVGYQCHSTAQAQQSTGAFGMDRQGPMMLRLMRCRIQHCLNCPCHCLTLRCLLCCTASMCRGLKRQQQLWWLLQGRTLMLSCLRVWPTAHHQSGSACCKGWWQHSLSVSACCRMLYISLVMHGVELCVARSGSGHT